RRAASTARAASSGPPRATSANFSPVDGSIESNVSPDTASASWSPITSWWVPVIVESLLVLLPEAWYPPWRARIAPVLIDGFMPEFDVSEHHVARVQASSDRAYEAARRVDLARSRAVRGLYFARGMPMLLRGRRRASRT